jgi:hypothetical protein
MPTQRNKDGLFGTTTSLLFHGLLIALLIYMSREVRPVMFFEEVPQGAGGINLPVGGGGGGTQGTGGLVRRMERIQYWMVNPSPPQTPQPIEPIKEAVKPPPTPPVEKPPEVKPPEIQMPPPAVEVKLAAANILGSIDSLMRGRGGGSGNDGTSGNGPGTGGGVGSGVGTGRGSGTGPGTGGGDGNIYQPQPLQIVLLPDPPNKLRPLDVTAQFDVDADGKVLNFTFRPTGDRGYDRKIEAKFKELRFRPAVDVYGNPVRARAELSFSYR